MRIKNIRFENNDVFKDLEVDFCENNGIPSDTVVIISENGTGKYYPKIFICQKK